jgi:phosphoglycerate dehydrogenase-like enzyme
MDSAPLRILVYDQFVSELSRAISVPNTLTGIRDQSDSEMAEIVSETDIVVSSLLKPAWLSHGAEHLRLVHSDGAGIDGISVADLPPGCKVCNVHGHERALAEIAFMDMLILQKNLFKLDSSLRKGDWSWEMGNMRELRNYNLLVLGLGPAGSEIVRWGHFMGMNVTALTRSPSAERARKAGLQVLGSLRELGSHLAAADFIVIAIPASNETIDLIGEKELQKMKPSAFLINVGRAKVVNEQALYEALRTRKIAGAGLDVWYQYPEGTGKELPSHFPFQDLDNVVMTPHKPTIETMEYRWTKIGKNIGRLARGEPLENVVYTA